MELLVHAMGASGRTSVNGGEHLPLIEGVNKYMPLTMKQYDRSIYCVNPTVST